MQAGSTSAHAHRHILDVHLLTPETRKLEQDLTGALSLNYSSNGIVSATNPALRFEIDVSDQIELRASNKAVVSKLVFHFTKQNTTGIHVWLSQNATKLSVLVL